MKNEHLMSQFDMKSMFHSVLSFHFLFSVKIIKEKTFTADLIKPLSDSFDVFIQIHL